MTHVLRPVRAGNRGAALAILLGYLTLRAAAGATAEAERPVEFREPRRTTYLIEPGAAKASLAADTNSWTRARVAGTTNYVAMGSRIVLRLKPGTELAPLIGDRGLTVARRVSTHLYLLQAKDSATAISQAQALAGESGVEASYPVMRRALRRMGRYAPAPSDPYFTNQWHLENRGTNGVSRGLDLNVRSAWSSAQGEGVVVAVADDGIDLTHPDLSGPTAGQPHFNFDTYTDNGSPRYSDSNHGTAVSGLIAASTNSVGVAGVAPRASLASWVIFGQSIGGQDTIVGDDALMEMFQHAQDVVSVQNHSWGIVSGSMYGLDALSDQGIHDAVTLGRSGKGEVIVRAGGNYRDDLMNANDDGYANDPRVISVAAARYDGLFCSYSSPGACLLVGAPSGDPNQDTGLEDPAYPNIMTTDRVGSRGYNTSGSGDRANYCFGDTGFNGTSASTPEISGVVALILSANPSLTYRDVQQVLLQSARFANRSDADLRTNGAGFLVSHNLGYGVPDAGLAVAIAKRWVNRPAATEHAYAQTDFPSVPTQCLRVICEGTNLASAVASIPAWPCQGPHADAATAVLPLVYVGLATEDIAQDLTGKGALIQRGTSLFSEKLARAARAGASFAVVYNNAATGSVYMIGTAFAPIPAVFIGRTEGETLRAYLSTNANLTARIQYDPAVLAFDVPDTLTCEHVGVRLTVDTPSRGDLRVSLVSPSGTRSVLQNASSDTSQGISDWSYWSVHHFYESSFGQWRLEIGNELSGNAATVVSAELVVQGVAISDTDHDGLDDTWEVQSFGALAYGPADNPAGDGYSNARKQCLDLAAARYTPLLPPGSFLLERRNPPHGFPGGGWPRGRDSVAERVRPSPHRGYEHGGAIPRDRSGGAVHRV